ncbi:hypothetical protein HPB50_014690 [Hyalomma asiaticum]|uniref:Uncharacterized protein n=1 Tax=Hyalomma asiaticum TaxID=266040 RepID=A0ACB7SW12_HYAAI|nr:hypothetical protein HPB50_014690 [Hyalomma asiaticum]
MQLLFVSSLFAEATWRTTGVPGAEPALVTTRGPPRQRRRCSTPGTLRGCDVSPGVRRLSRHARHGVERRFQFVTTSGSSGWRPVARHRRLEHTWRHSATANSVNGADLAHMAADGCLPCCMAAGFSPANEGRE